MEPRDPVAVMEMAPVPPAPVLGSSFLDAAPKQIEERRRSLRWANRERPTYADEPLPKEPARRRNGKAKAEERLEAAPNGKKQVGRPSKQAKTEAPEGVAAPALDIKPISCRPVAPDSCIVGESSGAAGGDVEDTENSWKVRAKETLRAFTSHYLHFVQEEQRRVKEIEQKRKLRLEKPVLEEKSPSRIKDKRVANKVKEAKNHKNKKTEKGKDKAAEQKEKRPSMRPDLKAITKMQQINKILYPEKKIGHLPGIDVGDQFYSRAELVVLGIHSHWLNGIDYMGQNFKGKAGYENFAFPLATCIVMSGMYEDDLDNSEEIVYTGQGGHDLLGNKLQVADQKLERGNLALKNSMDNGNLIRVVRGHEAKDSYTGKVYTYDGLYKVVKYWIDKGCRGHVVYKYTLKRLEGQASLTTSQVRFAREEVPRSLSEIRGLACEDISGGQEKFPIPATNLIDDPPIGPSGFVYSKELQIPSHINIPVDDSIGCKCAGDCADNKNCSCAGRNDYNLPYVLFKNARRLVEAKAMVFECGANCRCNNNCINRTSQQEMKYRLEVFKTASKGWGVRSWDVILPGAPICEYTGILRKTDEIDILPENNYIFDIDCLQTMKGLDGRKQRPGSELSLASLHADHDSEDPPAPEYCIDAGNVGNVARFINHSCQPNLFIQCVLSSHNDARLAKVMLFAADTIQPLQELTYDYGYRLDSVVGSDGNVVQLACRCGAPDCRKRLY